MKNSIFGTYLPSSEPVAEAALFKLIFGTQMFFHDLVKFFGRISPFFQPFFPSLFPKGSFLLFLPCPVIKDSGNCSADDGQNSNYS